MKLTVNESFITHRMIKMETYNQRGRSNRAFAMAIDCELFEHQQIEMGYWKSHDSWMVDGITPANHNVDVKFIRKYWNVSREKTLNLIKQRKILDGYLFCEWVERPNRPFELGDKVELAVLGQLSFDEVADNLRKSYKEPDGFYVDARALLRPDGEVG